MMIAIHKANYESKWFFFLLGYKRCFCKGTLIPFPSECRLGIRPVPVLTGLSLRQGPSQNLIGSIAGARGGGGQLRIPSETTQSSSAHFIEIFWATFTCERWDYSLNCSGKLIPNERIAFAIQEIEWKCQLITFSI